MSIFSSFLKPAAPVAPKAPSPPSVPPVPKSLPKITAPQASDIAQHSNLSPAGQALLKPQQTPAEHLQALQDHHLSQDMVKTMAHGMPDHEGVHWAAQSAEKVSDKLPPHDVSAMKAAQAWVKNPTEANKAAAAQAAGKADFKGPGAWAAQGAAWSQPAKAGAAATPRLTPHAVSGAVMSAAAIKANPALAAPVAKVPDLKAPTLQAPTLEAPKMAAPQIAAPQTPPPTVPPNVQAQTFKEQHPFVALGLDIASGKNVPA